MSDAHRFVALDHRYKVLEIHRADCETRERCRLGWEEPGGNGGTGVNPPPKISAQPGL